MYDDFAPRLAQILTEYSQPIQKGDYVLITTSTAAKPIVLALYEAVLRRGGHPITLTQFPELSQIFMELASEDQLDFLDPAMPFLMEKIDVIYNVMAPTNTKVMSDVDPARTARYQKTRRPLIETYFKAPPKKLRRLQPDYAAERRANGKTSAKKRGTPKKQRVAGPC